MLIGLQRLQASNVARYSSCLISAAIFRVSYAVCCHLEVTTFKKAFYAFIVAVATDGMLKLASI
jgi:hypothetical protein